MTGPARAVVLAVSAALFLGGLAFQVHGGGGWALIVFAAVIAASVLLEGRYRGGRRNPATRLRWQRTGEREVDSETGRIIEVWFDPVTGERHYEPVSDE